MNVGSLFSGIGGMDHGLARAGFRHVFFAETDAYRRAVLAHQFPDVPIYDDVRSVGREAVADSGERVEPNGGSRADAGRGVRPPGLDLLCGGFPCQDVSVAGQRRGLAGSRSGLFYEFARIADAFRPRWLLVENVPGLFSSNGGRDFGAVVGTLADIGYGVAWRILDSRYFGVPQRRRRVFIVGALADGDPRAAAERAGQVLAVGTRCPGHPATGTEAGSESAVASLSGLGNGGPDDNDGQAGRLVADTIRSHPRPGSNSNGNLVAPPLMFGSSRGGPNSLRAGFTGDGHIVATQVGSDEPGGANLAPEGATDGSSRDQPSVAAPLTSGGHPNSNAPGRRKEDDVNLVTGFHMLQDPISEAELAPAWGKGNKTGTALIGVQQGTTVRRLMPVECERLQALPDEWTQLGDTADSKRYAALGDAVTASVAYWIGSRMKTATVGSPAHDELCSSPDSEPFGGSSS